MQSYLGRRPTAVHGHILHRSRDVSTERMAESKKKQKRARKANFSGDEVDKLVGLVEVNYKTLVSKFCNTATLKSKNDTWAKITRKINSDEQSLRLKWTLRELRPPASYDDSTHALKIYEGMVNTT